MVNLKAVKVIKCEHVVAFVDRDWESGPIDWKSVSGWCTFLYENPIFWGQRGQLFITIISTMAEYVAIMEKTKEVLLSKEDDGVY